MPQPLDLSPWEHSHEFTAHSGKAERNTWLVIGLTTVMMVAEIAAGLLTKSMALLADGWHMSTHVAAFGITAAAYWYARRYAQDRRFTFGTGKVSVLGGFTSAIVLAVVALLMAGESALRFFNPEQIHFDQAILVASIGLGVNLLSAFLLHDHHGHEHGHDHCHHHHGHDHHHHGAADHNLRAAYLHVLADALTSVTAIIALLSGKYLGWNWLDPLMGIVGAVVIAIWARGLLRDTSSILLDSGAPAGAEAEVRETLEQEPGVWITDLHIWQVAPGRLGVIVALVVEQPASPDHYRALLSQHEEYVHVSVEVHQLPRRESAALAAR